MKQYIDEAAAYIKSKTDSKPSVGLVLGSGLGAYGETLENAVHIAYKDIPHMKTSTVVGHAGAFILGEKAGKTVIAMQGRLHYYEGHSLDDVVFPIRLMAALGVGRIIITNAAGGVNTAFAPGDLMLITDHINLTGINVLHGQASLEFGDRFPSLSQPYDRAWQALVQKSGEKAGIKLQKGVYYYCTGPSYETAAEIRAIRALGGDAVGMSTVHETVCAVQMGMRVLGISCISNMACGVLDQPLEHKEVLETTARVREQFVKFLDEILTKTDS